MSLSTSALLGGLPIEAACDVPQLQPMMLRERRPVTAHHSAAGFTVTKRHQCCEATCLLNQGIVGAQTA